MDISPVGTLTIPRPCGEIPCGQCATCRHIVMLHMAAYALRAEDREEDDPKAVLLDLLDKMKLPG